MINYTRVLFEHNIVRRVRVQKTEDRYNIYTYTRNVIYFPNRRIAT